MVVAGSLMRGWLLAPAINAGWRVICKPEKYQRDATKKVFSRAGILQLLARQLNSINKLMIKLTTKSQIEFGQARY
jgi:hypothetical protein